MWYVQQKLLKSRGHPHRSWKIIQFHSSRISLKTLALFIFCIPFLSLQFLETSHPMPCELLRTRHWGHSTHRWSTRAARDCEMQLPHPGARTNVGWAWQRVLEDGKVVKLQTLENVTLKMRKRVLLNKEVCNCILLLSTTCPSFQNLTQILHQLWILISGGTTHFYPFHAASA